MRPQHLPNQHAHNFNNRGFRPNHHTHFLHGLPPYPCSICTQQGIPNAYNWKQQCPFNQHQLRQTPFTFDLSLAINTVSQSSENSVSSQQISNQRQHASTETSVPAYWQLQAPRSLISADIEEIVNTSEEVFSPLTVKELSPNLIQLLSEYSHVFSKNKYDVDQPFEYISVGTLSLSVGGFNYYNSSKKILHLIIDHATHYVWAFTSKSETTETYANCLKQLFQIQTPIKLLTDRNGAFTSSRFKRFLRNYNVKQLLTTSHHPQTNGKCERVNQSIVTKLRCKVNSSTKIPWTKFLEQVINEYNLTPHSVTKFLPAYLLLGTLLYTPPLAQNQVYPPVKETRRLAKENTIKYHEKNKIKCDACFIDSPFEPCDIVMYEEFNYPNRRKLSPIFSGPYEIVQKLSDVNYEITSLTH
ncbi:transposon Tf2-11 polyprotein [Trichonephila clavipes]|nr:transposon Tf2-11 polyprotein [Trichonephila clavipes]